MNIYARMVPCIAVTVIPILIIMLIKFMDNNSNKNTHGQSFWRKCVKQQKKNTKQKKKKEIYKCLLYVDATSILYAKK